ncbi:hypothetical protein CEQ90_11100 [Lewinellaceae bacterium SD302]|nr:hypothetical protein CEQ90_11100 [Lewinellaceae bacterium SD302]
MKRKLLTFMAATFCVAIFAQDPALYRTIDGTQNNVNNPEWGAAHTALLQIAGVGFADGFSSPAGADRPNARYLSNLIFDQPDLLPDPMTLSDFTWVFGQFMDHDLGLTEGTEEPFNVPVPQGDPDLDPLGFGNVEISVNRTKFMDGTGLDVDNPAQYANEITAFIDGSAVYGSDEERAAWLRSFEDGKMKVSTGNLLPYNTIDGEFDSPIDPDAPHMGDDVGFSPRLFVAGDVRANENPLLTSFHTLFVREHNRRAEIIKTEHPDWTDEEIYQLARKYVGGHIAAITYNEWLPAMGVPIADYSGYDETIHPQLSNTFTAAGFRVGHTLLNSLILRVDNNGNELPEGHMLLRNGFFNVNALPEVGGIDPYLAGMGQQVQQTMDSRIVDDVRNFLFGPPGAGGTDLASINIARGRERGLPSFNAIRQAHGLAPYFFLEQINADVSVYSLLFQAYFGNVNEVDPWIGMLAESPMPDALFGQTLLTILSQQFTRLRDGDRFFYLNDPVLTEDQKADIHNTTFRDIIMHNTGISLMQDNVFLAMPYADICGSATSTVTGNVTIHESNNQMNEVQIDYLVDGEMQTNLFTDPEGNFNFEGIPVCEAGTLAPAFENDDWINGVSVQDIVLISRHILGIETFDSPYEYLAADANVDGNIMITDIIAIRRLILDLDQALPTDEPMWNFIPADYVFANPEAPWLDNYPTSITLPTPAMMLINQDFVAYKRGDVNGNAEFDGEDFQGTTDVLARSNDASVNIIIEDLVLSAGQPTEVDLSVNFQHQAAEQADYQFSLAGLNINKVTSSSGATEYAHLNEWGALNFCGQIVNGSSQHFTLTLSDERGGSISDLLEISTRRIPAMAVLTLDDTVLEEAIGLDYQSSNVGSMVSRTTATLPAYPNPFVDQISFAVPNQLIGGPATLELYAADGRIVLQEQKDLAAATPTQWTLLPTNLSAGNYFYRLQTATGEVYRGQVSRR